jgi:protein-tyrosine phosphatase
VTKPAAIALGVGTAALACAGIALGTAGAVRLAASWTALACGVACAAYVWNRPAWLGKRDGGASWRLLVVLPYLAALRVACVLMRWWRPPDAPVRVAPGIWVAGRVRPADVPAAVSHVVDLVAEFPAPGALRRRAGYRYLPVLDGGFPPDAAAFLSLVRDLLRADGDVLVHCDSGRGRAPTVAAALLLARGLADDPAEAIAGIRARRPVAAPTRSDLAFLDRMLPELRAMARRARRERAAAPRAVTLSPPPA